MNRIRLVLVFLITIGAGLSALAVGARAQNQILKNPRVAELEDKLTADATTYLKGRFPNRPFMVVVSIDPLRRYQVARNADSSDNNLPYMDVQSPDEIQDEWDDPEVPLSDLMQRVQKAVVTVSLPSSVSDDDVAEIKSSLISYLHLVPARDEVQVQRRNWSTDNTAWLYIGMSFALAGLLLIGIFFINRSSASRFGEAVARAKGGGERGYSAPTAASAPTALTTEKAESPSGDVTVSDPIRLRELATRLVDDILKDGAFPNHQDMFALEQFGREHPRALGAVLKQFPLAMQKKLFSYSFHPCWMEAFHRPGSLNIDAIEKLQQISQNARDPKSDNWEKLLLVVWRLDDSLASFVKTLKQDEALAILAELPKSISLSAARKAFPGTWGVLLDPQFSPKRPGPAEIAAITEAAIRLKPLHDFALTQKYKSEAEVIEFLLEAEIAEERDVYGASPEDSLIHNLRTPFYPVLDQPVELLKELVPMANLEQWAIALFNVSKSERRAIESTLNEKQRYLFVEKMRQLDANPPDKRLVGETRGKIAGLLLVVKNAAAQRAAEEQAEKARQQEERKDGEAPLEESKAA